jgi:hypothetical protein
MMYAVGGAAGSFVKLRMPGAEGLGFVPELTGYKYALEQGRDLNVLAGLQRDFA